VYQIEDKQMDMISTVSEMNGMERTEAMSSKELELKEACAQVEGLFLKMLMKEGMASMVENAEGHSGSVLSYSLEQTAEEIARSGAMGIAESIYEQLSANL
jgi:Rod binding domain-containing protein